MHYYQFNIADYRKDTVHLTPIEHYIYRTLIDWYYMDERPIIKETQVVMRRLSLDFSFEQNVQNVLNDFFIESEKGWEHKRINIEIRDYHEMAEKNRINGNKGGRPKKTQSVANWLQNETQNNPTVTLTNNHKPITINHKPDKNSRADFALPDWIDKTIWELWIKTRKGKKMIPEQMMAQVKKLEKWKNAGLDYAKALSDSAENGWQGLFEPQKKINGTELPWWATNELMLAKGKELGTSPRPGEGWQEFKSRLSAMTKSI